VRAAGALITGSASEVQGAVLRAAREALAAARAAQPVAERIA
jgi:hypothetical protein